MLVIRFGLPSLRIVRQCRPTGSGAYVNAFATARASRQHFHLFTQPASRAFTQLWFCFLLTFSKTLLLSAVIPLIRLLMVLKLSDPSQRASSSVRADRVRTCGHHRGSCDGCEPAGGISVIRRYSSHDVKVGKPVGILPLSGEYPQGHLHPQMLSNQYIASSGQLTKTKGLSPE